MQAKVNPSINQLERLMEKTIKLAEKARSKGEVPVGAMIISNEGEVLAKAYNQKEEKKDACAHAEILAIRKASKRIKEWRLLGATLVVTLEPCPMCLAAMVQARIKKLIFGAYDKKGGALSLNYNFHQDKRLNHKFEVIGGIKSVECSKRLSDFFKKKRVEKV